MDLTGQPTHPSSPRRDGDAALVDKVCGWIELHLDEDIDWARLVRVSGVPANRLQQLFTRYRRTTPMMYIRQRRTERDTPRAAQEEVPPPPAFLATPPPLDVPPGSAGR